MSQTGAFELLGPRLGLGSKSRQSYINLDMGDRQPTEAEAAILADWLGGYPVEAPTGGEAPPVDLAAAIRELVEELRASRQERVEQAKRLHALEVAVALLARQDGGSDPARLVPSRSGE